MYIFDKYVYSSEWLAKYHDSLPFSRHSTQSWRNDWLLTGFDCNELGSKCADELMCEPLKSPGNDLPCKCF